MGSRGRGIVGMAIIANDLQLHTALANMVPEPVIALTAWHMGKASYMESPKPPDAPFGTGRSAEAEARRGGGPAAPPRIDVRALLRGGREAVMLHGDQEYRLRITRNGKLILTK